jgi:hypothetical protein
MVQRGDGTRFALEAFGEFFVSNFDGDNPIEPRVARLVHLAHAAGAKASDNLVRPELVADGERHVGELSSLTDRQKRAPLSFDQSHSAHCTVQ